MGQEGQGCFLTDGTPCSSQVDYPKFQQNGYGIMELVMDKSNPDTLIHEYVAYGDFGITMDTKDIQEL